MIGLLTIVGIVGALALRKHNQSVSGIGRNWYGGNSGYDGYSMSVRAREARKDGRFPKTDFKKFYNLTQKTFDILVDLGFIYISEWHHTSSWGNRTNFYSWEVDGVSDLYLLNKKTIDKLAREDKIDEIRDIFDSFEDEIREKEESAKEADRIEREKAAETVRNYVESLPWDLIAEHIKINYPDGNAHTDRGSVNVFTGEIVLNDNLYSEDFLRDHSKVSRKAIRRRANDMLYSIRKDIIDDIFTRYGIDRKYEFEVKNYLKNLVV